MTRAAVGIVVWASFALAMILWPLTRPAGPGPVARPSIVVTGGPHGLEADPVRDPLDPAWTPPDGRWHDPFTFYDEAQRHPCMIGVTA